MKKIIHANAIQPSEMRLITKWMHHENDNELLHK